MIVAAAVRLAGLLATSRRGLLPVAGCGNGRRAAAGLGVLSLLAAALLTPVHADPTAAPPADTATYPLADKMWSRADGALLAPDALSKKLVAFGDRTTILLLGEVHDNPAHHRVQSALAYAFLVAPPRASRDNTPSVVMEMIPADQQLAIDIHLAGLAARDSPEFSAVMRRKASELGAAVKWEERGWPDWAIYQPIAEAALLAGARIVAGDAPRDIFMNIARKGAQAVDVETAKRMTLDQPLSAAEDKALADELYESHCRMMPRERLANMAVAQRFRDAHLADRLMASPEPRVLIAGNGHVRNSAVPRYLKARGVKPENIISVQFIEVDEGATDPAAYIPMDANGQPDGDYFVFTPALKREDPCAAFRKPAASAADKK